VLRWLERDRRILPGLVRDLNRKNIEPRFSGQMIVDIGKFFLGTPYREGTLETEGPETLVVNLREFDCMTFVETVVALACLIRSGDKSFERFRSLLQKIRYRAGRPQGYASRLHYFSDWIYDNQKRGVVRDVTAKVGGRPSRKTINFMTMHPNHYPPLRDPAIFWKMKTIERTMNRRSLFLIPKKLLRRSEDQIHEGDLIAIMTNTEGLDVQHVGFAVRVKNRIHLLHASSQEGQVAVSADTLYRYLMKNRARSGVRVVRILEEGIGRRTQGKRGRSVRKKGRKICHDCQSYAPL